MKQTNMVSENYNGQKSPLTEKHSDMIEKDYKPKKEFIDIELKRHNDDNMELYRYHFLRNDLPINNSEMNSLEDMMMKMRINSRISNSESIGKQKNIRTGFKRNIFRDKKIVQVEIVKDENNEIDSTDIEKIFVSGINDNVEIGF